MEVTTIRIRKFSEPRMLVEFVVETQDVEDMGTRLTPMTLDPETTSFTINARLDHIKMWVEEDLVCFKIRDDKDARTYKYDYRKFRNLEGGDFVSPGSVISHTTNGNDGFSSSRPSIIPGVRYFL